MTNITVPTTKPPDWINRILCRLLRTPGLQAWLGRSTAIITFTGRRSGRSITIPVTYTRDGDQVYLLTKAVRQWWKNFTHEPAVRLRLAGVEHTGTARAVSDVEDRIPLIRQFLRLRPRDARVYGVKLGADGTLRDEDARRLAPQLIPIEIALD